MLKSLHIENIAVIEKTDIDFTPGLNVLTGETGAGKSIIIDSIGALLGDRITKDSVRHGAESAVVIGVFDDDTAKEWLDDNELPLNDGELFIQRKITTDGKNSCRVNGTPVTVTQLKELGNLLIDIHGQNDGRRMADEKNHIAFLDSFCEDKSPAVNFKREYQAYTALKKERDALNIDENEKLLLADSLRYRIEEIGRAELKQGEEQELTERRDLLKNSEKLTEYLSAAYSLLYEDDNSAINNTQSAESLIARASNISPQFDDAAKSLAEATFLIKNAAELINDFLSELEFSPEEYNSLESRLQQISRLERKYNTDESGLLELLSESEKKLGDLEYSEDRIKQLNKKLEKQLVVCREASEALSSYRKKCSQDLESKIISELKDLNMKSVRFAVEFSDVQEIEGFNGNGKDDVRFIMSANAGEALGRISKIASGGELSRIMLAIKNVFSAGDSVPTMIFDEIDTGVSGISAQRVAEKLFSVSNGKQVMCVTHLPQLAAMADSHYLIRKTESNGRTYTQVEALDRNGRKEELSRLYGGDVVSDSLMETAAEMLDAAKSYKERQ